MTCARRTVLFVFAVLVLLPVSSVLAQQPKETSLRGGVPAQTPPATARSEVRALTQGFSVVLVLADLQASGAQDDVPPAARRALADMKDFLPYKSYKLLDAAWILGQGTTGTITRLRGAEGQEYELHMTATSVLSRPTEMGSRNSSTAAVNVRFTLNEASPEREMVYALQAEQARRAVESERRVEELQRSQEISRLEAELRAAQREKNQDRIKDLQTQLTRARNRARGQQETPRPSSKRHGGTVIHTTFTMDVGETVVVGTSRLRDNSRALIALLTAVPMKGSRAPAEGR